MIASDFLTLPNKRQLPEYYQQIKLPIALDTIENKLRRTEVPDLSTLEGLFKRMVLNAREFNEKRSQIYDDAERIKRVVSSFMTQHNPAYKTSGYVAPPTPIPGEPPAGDEGAIGEDDLEEVEEEVETVAPVKRRGRPPRNPQAQVKGASSASSEPKYTGVSFTGLTFQQAQEKVVEDVLQYKEDPEFVNRMSMLGLLLTWHKG